MKRALLVAALGAAFSLGSAAQDRPDQQPRTGRKPITEAHARGAEGIVWNSVPRASWGPDGWRIRLQEGGKTRYLHPETLEEIPAPPGRANDAGDRQGNRQRAGRGGRPPEVPGKRILTKSPDGQRQSWVADGNLVIGDAEGEATWQVTTDGSDEMLNGILDWVYQEELYGRGNFRGHWWSPDSRYVTFLRLDESPVREFTVVDHVPKGFLETERAVVAEVTNYPKAGDPNPVCTVGIADVETQKVVWVDLSAFPADLLTVRVSYTPAGDRVVLQIQDRIQTWMELVYADPATGEVTRVLREESPTWVNRLPAPDWQQDGTFLWMSERTGYQHVYHYRADGTLIRAITAGEWQVRDVEKVDWDQGYLWFEGTKDGAINRNLYRIRTDGTQLVRLTTGDGQHRWAWNADRTMFLDTVSSVEMLPEVRICIGDTGITGKALARAELTGAEEYFYSAKERVVITARDGYPLDATIVPAAPDVREPAIYLSTYSGPDAPSVRNSFRVSSREQYLAQEGVISLQVNVRSASGRGQVHTGTCYKQLGVQELRDLEDAVSYVLHRYQADPTRVAIDGWSYGGFMAAYALTHSKAFTLGFAGAGVHDWQLYDTIYTERYMSTPQLNKAGYDATSVVKAAKNLHGHLVILHGTMDDNVHLQNSMQLIYALQDAGKEDFELMLYPRSRHGVRSRHLDGFKWRILMREFRLGPIHRGG